MAAQPILESVITCPTCGHPQLETVPVEVCQWFYGCVNCGETLKSKAGDCCVFCSYGSVPCPPIQIQGKTGHSCCGDS